MAAGRGEEHDAGDMIRVYKDTMREEAMDFCVPYVRAPTQQELKIAMRVTAYNAGGMYKAARIDKRDEQCHKWKSYRRSVRTYHADISKMSLSKDNSASYGILSISV